MSKVELARELDEAFQCVQFDRWDAIMAEDVLINSPAVRDINGLKTLKEFAVQVTDLGYRIDLIDASLDHASARGGGRSAMGCRVGRLVSRREFGSYAHYQQQMTNNSKFCNASAVI